MEKVSKYEGKIHRGTMQVETLSKDPKKSWLDNIVGDLMQVLENKNFLEKYPDFVKHARVAYEFYSEELKELRKNGPNTNS